MSRKALFYAVVACFALTSCAPMQGITDTAPTSKVCAGAQCDIDVSVSADNKIVVVDFIFVKQPVVIRWNLPQGSPYTIKIEIIGAGSNFDCRSTGQRQYMCNDMHRESSPTVYKYWVKLDGPNHLEVDPYIVND